MQIYNRKWPVSQQVLEDAEQEKKPGSLAGKCAKGRARTCTCVLVQSRRHMADQMGHVYMKWTSIQHASPSWRANLSAAPSADISKPPRSRVPGWRGNRRTRPAMNRFADWRQTESLLHPLLRYVTSIKPCVVLVFSHQLSWCWWCLRRVRFEVLTQVSN